MKLFSRNFATIIVNMQILVILPQLVVAERNWLYGVNILSAIITRIISVWVLKRN